MNFLIYFSIFLNIILGYQLTQFELRMDDIESDLFAAKQELDALKKE